jgi:hypothetical protein
MKSNKLNQESALKYIHGGNSIFTVINTLTTKRFTFKVKKHKTEDVYFVSVLTGTDAYQYIGFLKYSNFLYSNKSTISKDSQSVKVFSYIYQKLKEKNLPEFVEFWHEGVCGKCGRKLTVPESIESGFGPECIKRVRK